MNASVEQRLATLEAEITELKAQIADLSATLARHLAKHEEKVTLAVAASPKPRPAIRSVGKLGVRISGVTFTAPALAAHVGEFVIVKGDPVDPHRMWVFDKQNKFICVAFSASAGRSRSPEKSIPIHFEMTLVVPSSPIRRSPPESAAGESR